MRGLPFLILRASLRTYSTAAKKVQLPIVRIKHATFYRNHPSTTSQDLALNPPLFPGVSFEIPSDLKKQQHWAIVGPSSAGKSTFLEILRGQHLCIPPAARSFPYLSSDEARLDDCCHRDPLRAIRCVGFHHERGTASGVGVRGAYLSARYESRREDTDFSVLDYLKGTTDLNPLEQQEGNNVDNRVLEKVIRDLGLDALVNMPMANLSNGQSRRARIARGLLGKPLILLLDEPFVGLDPPTITTLDPLLYSLAKTGSPRLILALRPQDPLPEWITHMIHLGSGSRILHKGDKETVLEKVSGSKGGALQYRWTTKVGFEPQRGIPKMLGITEGRNIAKVDQSRSRDGFLLSDIPKQYQPGEHLIEMNGVSVKYGTKHALGGWRQHIDGKRREGLWWTVRRGERWGVFGPNGSGKTTLLSLICSDHPQAYSQPLKVFNSGRLPQPGQPGISVFDIQARIGQSSPEIHAFFPQNLSLRRTVESVWADTFLGTPRLTYENDVAVDSCLSWFEAELNPAYKVSSVSMTTRKAQVAKENNYAANTDWADDIRFRDVPVSAQKILLLLRAIVKKPDLVILDEAFSGMDAYIRDKCMLFLTWGETKSVGIDTSRPEENKRVVVDTDANILGNRIFGGLTPDQALLCVSHNKEEVPDVVREWISLPEASKGTAARFGRLKGPLGADEKAWEEIWRI